MNALIRERLVGAAIGAAFAALMWSAPLLWSVFR